MSEPLSEKQRSYLEWYRDRSGGSAMKEVGLALARLDYLEAEVARLRSLAGIVHDGLLDSATAIDAAVSRERREIMVAVADMDTRSLLSPTAAREAVYALVAARGPLAEPLPMEVLEQRNARLLAVLTQLMRVSPRPGWRRNWEQSQAWEAARTVLEEAGIKLEG